jgi:hypothetical protein
VGFNEMLLLLVFDRTESTGRPSFKPDTLVGVFSFASSRSSRTSLPVHSFPVFRVYLQVLILIEIPSANLQQLRESFS